MDRIVKFNILKYGVLFFIVNLIVNFIFAYASGFYRASPTGYLIEKTNYYKKKSNEYNLVFIGDSRTYCGMHPEILDKFLGTRSINISKWAHWFPTQYSQIKEIINFIPESTTVVWSVGHENFLFDGYVRKVFPIKIKNAFDLATFGYDWGTMKQNLISYTPGFYLWGFRQEIYDRIKFILDQKIYKTHSQAPLVSMNGGHSQRINNLNEIMDSIYIKNINVHHVESLKDSDKLTSYALYMNGGGYCRIEVEPSFFREKQRQNELSQKDDNKFDADPGALNTFKSILDLFKKHKVKLVVNEFEEAPYFYKDRAYGIQCRQFMEEIRALVEEHGYPYIRVPFESFSNDHYFDYNHLNSKGIKKFSDLFVNRIISYL